MSRFGVEVRFAPMLAFAFQSDQSLSSSSSPSLGSPVFTSASLRYPAFFVVLSLAAWSEGFWPIPSDVLERSRAAKCKPGSPRDLFLGTYVPGRHLRLSVLLGSVSGP